MRTSPSSRARRSSSTPTRLGSSLRPRTARASDRPRDRLLPFLLFREEQRSGNGCRTSFQEGIVRGRSRPMMKAFVPTSASRWCLRTRCRSAIRTRSRSAHPRQSHQSRWDKRPSRIERIVRRLHRSQRRHTTTVARPPRLPSRGETSTCLAEYLILGPTDDQRRRRTTLGEVKLIRPRLIAVKSASALTADVNIRLRS